MKNNYWKERAEKFNKTNWVKNSILLDALLSLIPNKKNYGKILEVGVGTGVVANKVVDKYGPMIGLDKSSEMMSKIENKDITTIVGDAHSLPFDNDQFDLIYMRNLIHYLENQAKAFSEVFRCLKNEGLYLFSQVIPFSDEISEEYDQLIGRNIHYPNHNEIIELFSDFTVLNKVEYVLKTQSIMNWLNNTCRDEDKKKQIIKQHRRTSNTYKNLVNYNEENDDIFVDIKHLFILATKF